MTNTLISEHSNSHEESLDTYISTDTKAQAYQRPLKKNDTKNGPVIKIYDLNIAQSNQSYSKSIDNCRREEELQIDDISSHQQSKKILKIDPELPQRSIRHNKSLSNMIKNNYENGKA